MATDRTAAQAVEAALRVVDQRDGVLRAFVHLDPDRARTEADQVDARGGPLCGTVLGVKDVFDTIDLPTECGTPIYAGRRPRSDAAAVALLRRAGATVLGKTVTTELALFSPGPTTNPRRATHTPGGSSSGSAAAVAAGMCDVALGTQTAGSVIRPASYCGVLGFKPTFGSVSTAGVKFVAPSLDTVGWFAREVNMLDAARVALTGRAPAGVRAHPPRLVVARTDLWDDAGADGRDAVLQAASRARAAGATVIERELPPSSTGLASEQPIVMAYEAARALAWEHANRREQLSESILGILDWGAAIDPEEYDRVRDRASRARVELGAWLADADAVLALAVAGEALEGLAVTGDPRFARLWTLLGAPTISVPGLVGSTGLPVGVQLVAALGGDAGLLSTAGWLHRVLSS